MTDVAVELPGEREHWLIFHHFRWTVPTKFCGTESLQIWLTYADSEGWRAAGELAGRALYDADSDTYAAPYASLAAEGYLSNSVIWGPQHVDAIFAAKRR